MHLIHVMPVLTLKVWEMNSTKVSAKVLKLSNWRSFCKMIISLPFLMMEFQVCVETDLLFTLLNRASYIIELFVIQLSLFLSSILIDVSFYSWFQRIIEILHFLQYKDDCNKYCIIYKPIPVWMYLHCRVVVHHNVY